MTRAPVPNTRRSLGLARARHGGVRLALRKIWNRVLFGPVFSFLERFGVHILPVHYYSPVPDTRRLRSHREWAGERSFEGIQFHDDEQRELLNTLAPYDAETSRLPDYREVERLALGEGYGEVEAHVFYAMIRHIGPKRIIEIGGGTSTWYAESALERNRENGAECTHVIIEPYARTTLRAFARERRIALREERTEAIPLEEFRALGPGDVLFIDSSHVVRLGGDVPYLYLDVLPALQPGVLVHIHDIPFPFHSPDPDYWVFRRHLFWTEPMLLHAFLAFNQAFRVRLCLSWMAHRHARELHTAFPLFDAKAHRPNSIWIERVA